MQVIDEILSDCGKYNAPDVGFQTINNPTWDSLTLSLQAAKYLHFLSGQYPYWSTFRVRKGRWVEIDKIVTH